jgi:hypothetical protein
MHRSLCPCPRALKFHQKSETVLRNNDRNRIPLGFSLKIHRHSKALSLTSDDRFSLNLEVLSMAQPSAEVAGETPAAPPPSEDPRDDPIWDIVAEMVPSEIADRLFKNAEDLVGWNYWPLPNGG